MSTEEGLKYQRCSYKCIKYYRLLLTKEVSCVIMYTYLQGYTLNGQASRVIMVDVGMILVDSPFCMKTVHSPWKHKGGLL